MHQHRSTLKQTNKGFKSKHATKGELKAKNRGKVERGPVKGSHSHVQTKADRRNQAKLIQQRKRAEVQGNARFYNGMYAPPKIVTVVPLCPDVNCDTAVADLLKNLELSFDEGTNILGTGALSVTGYVRGNTLSANRLIHIPKYGDFQIERIVKAPTGRHNEDSGETLHEPDPELQDSLISELEPDPLNAEQTWPTEEELADAEQRVAKKNGRRTVRVPKGTSEYQAAWIIDDEEEDDEDEDDEEDEDEDDEMRDVDDAPMEEVEDFEEEDDEEYEEIEIGGSKDDFDGEYDMAEDEEQYNEFLQRKKDRAEEDLEFPDELDTPKEIPARVRFQRYRGLKSLRTSPWDPYENLPVDYGRIFQFENFKRTRSRVLASDVDGVEAGERVTVIMRGVPKAAFDERRAEKAFCLFALFPHEHKMTVSCVSVQRVDPKTENSPIIKSKDPVMIQFGFRKYIIHPIYSSDVRGSTNKVARMERFFHHNRTVHATFYGPIVLHNEPVLMYQLTRDNQLDQSVGLLATGRTAIPNPERIIAKRILLTGHPFKINRRHAVVRFMFFNPTDVNYFKPVQLHTKLGRVGHIKESLGTHGYMKCIFDEQLKAHDTVCMSLYKRVFPKWGTTLWEGEPLEYLEPGAAMEV
ncbi:hypothetical protein HDU96_002439 [Phlyctochytrium bullatum]|nr:hypothetical protein HDU96_002439 [Phlyctochytrium bullatum]